MKAIGGRRRQIAGAFLRSALYLGGFGVAGRRAGRHRCWPIMIAGFVTSSVPRRPRPLRGERPGGRLRAPRSPCVRHRWRATAPALRRGPCASPCARALQKPGGGGDLRHGAASTASCVHGRLLPRTIRLGARNLVRNKRRTAATTLQIGVLVVSATVLGFLNMAISFGRGARRGLSPSSSGMRACTRRPAPLRLDAAAAERSSAGTAGVDA